MRIIKSFFSLLFFICALGYSQDSVKREFEISLQYGNASVQIDEVKSVGFFVGSDVKREFSLGKKYSILAGLTLNNFNLNASNFNIETKYVGLPVSFRSYFINNDKALFAEFGAYANYLYNAKFLDNDIGQTMKYKNSGNNFGVFYKLGYTSVFTESVKINIALFGAQDFATSLKSEIPDVKIKNQIGVEAGIGVNLF
ncbi:MULTISPECIES: hypothetical protein [Flavobacterium]|uniref:hypothetical protein n=1 Tax=Flavobacterium TaxID=237 RepID=UPI001FCB15AF|nr:MULTISPECIES: hypothetical protein [Flavobacterium]UOK43739.1 hypothetical protein LZF87_06360 [Flavobacterium enshiense]